MKNNISRKSKMEIATEGTEDTENSLLNLMYCFVEFSAILIDIYCLCIYNGAL
jgi:hypothetical protein